MSRQRLSPRKPEAGFYLVLITFLLPALIGFLAFSVDLGLIMAQRSQAQSTADGAALAGAFAAKRVFRWPGMTVTQKAVAVLDAVKAELTKNQFPAADGRVQVTYCPPEGYGGSVCLTYPTPFTSPNSLVAASAPSTYYPLASEYPNMTEKNTAAYVRVSLSEETTSFFGQVLGIMGFPAVNVSALARYKEGDYLPCPGIYIFVDGSPQQIDMKQSSGIVVQGGGIYMDSTSNNALSGTAGSYMTALWIQATGGTGNAVITYECTLQATPCPVLYQVLPADAVPIINVPTVSCPDPPAGQSTNYFPNNNLTGGVYVNRHVTAPISADPTYDATYDAVILTAGTYCGGLTIDGVGGSSTSPKVILRPRYDAATNHTDDVFHFKNTAQGNQDNGALNILNGSHVQGGMDINGNGVIDGVILYIPTTKPGQFSVNIDNSSVGGYLRIYANNLGLSQGALLDFTAYDLDLNGNRCGRPLQKNTWLVE